MLLLSGLPIQSSMVSSRILPFATLAVLLAVISTVSADDVKHKRVIVKVPKKINHIHHHHVKKVHVYKHKPKPIHSIHVVEEEEQIAPEWKGLFQGKRLKLSRHKGSSGGGGWKFEDEDDYGYGGEDEEDEDEEEEFHKSGSRPEPTVWRGKKKTGKWSGQHEGRTSIRSNWRVERPKRQKYIGSSYRPVQSGHRTRPKKMTRSKSTKNKKSRPRRPIDVEYEDYGEYFDADNSKQSSIWPERKEHISWRVRDHSRPRVPVVPQTTASPHFVVEDYRTEHSGEINLVKPEIQEVEAPKLAPKERLQPWAKPLVQEHLLEKEAYQQQWHKDVVQPSQLWNGEEKKSWSKPLFQEVPTWQQPAVQVPQYFSKPLIAVQQPLSLPQTNFPIQIKPLVQQIPAWQSLREQALSNPAIREPQLQPVMEAFNKPAVKEPEAWSQPIFQAPINHQQKTTDRPRMIKPVVQEHKEVLPKRMNGFRTEVDYSGTGYSSHVGHNKEGDAASFQTVRFGDKIRNS